MPSLSYTRITHSISTHWILTTEYSSSIVNIKANSHNIEFIKKNIQIELERKGIFSNFYFKTSNIGMWI